MPRIWRVYYSGGNCQATLEENTKQNIIHLKLIDIQVMHIYFEYTVMGYLKKFLETFGIKLNNFLVKLKTLKVKKLMLKVNGMMQV